MSDFAEFIQDRPRLVVLYRRGGDNSDQFSWGVVGGINILNLIAQISRAQADMMAETWIPECDHSPSAFVIAIDENHDFCMFKSSDIPTDPLIGMLEIVKALLVGSRVSQHLGSQRVPILGPDGRPIMG